MFAQGGGPGNNPRFKDGRFPAAETVTISGSLVVAHGRPAVKSGDTTYFVRGINRLAGFVDGLKEGAQVTIEGLSVTSPRDNSLKFLRPVKLTLNGKTYDMAPLASPNGFDKQSGPPQMDRRQFNGPDGQRPRWNDCPAVPRNQMPMRQRWQ